MKKTSLIFLSVLLLCSLSFSLPIEDNDPAKPVGNAKESRMNAGVDLGLAAGDFKGFLLGFGFQYGFSPAFFGEIEADINFNPMDYAITHTTFGVSTNGVYKFKMSDNVKMFVKAGISSTSVTVSYGGASIESKSQIGLNAGTGLELALAEKIGARVGGTFKVIFDPGDALIYFKFYGSLFYRF